MGPVLVKCPNCNLPIEVEEYQARKGLRCPECSTGFVPSGFERPSYDRRDDSPPLNFGLILWPVVLVLILGAIFTGFLPPAWGALFACLAIGGALVSQFTKK